MKSMKRMLMIFMVSFMSLSAGMAWNLFANTPAQSSGSPNASNSNTEAAGRTSSATAALGTSQSSSAAESASGMKSGSMPSERHWYNPFTWFNRNTGVSSTASVNG